MSGAVFLSYASQDAEPARRICDALRTAGIEVWFDQSELRGGDAWDSKIRKQIKECALFVPLISENTNARAEGYFRLEWKLAVDRSHLVAEDTPFILPVVLGDLSEGAARVPDKFREVQWTRISLSIPPEKFAERAARLLSGEPAPEATPRVHTLRGSAMPGSSRRSPPIWAMIAGAALAFAALYYFSRPKVEPANSAGAPSDSGPVSEAQELADKARAIYYNVSFTRADLAVADDLARRATVADPDSAYAWAVRAAVQAAYIQRNWAFDLKISQDTDAFAKRALAINPDETQALLALGYLMYDQGAFALSEVYLRQAYRTAPTDNRICRALGRAVWASGRYDEGVAIDKEAVQRDPRDVMARYDLALLYYGNGYAPAPTNFPAAMEQLDAALAIQPTDGLLLMKARLVGPWKGDLKAMQSLLDQISPEGRTEDRAVYFSMYCGLLERDPARVLAASELTVQDYFEDGTIAQPKAWSVALAYQIASKESLARLQWQAAESVLRKRIADNPNAEIGQEIYRAQLATTLAWLGRTDEAAQEIAPIESAWREQLNLTRDRILAQYYAALGDGVKSAPLLRQAFDKIPAVTKWTLKYYPWWDKLRGKPEFESLLADVGASDTKK
jgi:Flp pilus assembly protein TadD